MWVRRTFLNNYHQPQDLCYDYMLCNICEEWYFTIRANKEMWGDFLRDI